MGMQRWIYFDFWGDRIEMGLEFHSECSGIFLLVVAVDGIGVFSRVGIGRRWLVFEPL